jgi:hypothetical protein
LALPFLIFVPEISQNSMIIQGGLETTEFVLHVIFLHVFQVLQLSQLLFLLLFLPFFMLSPMRDFIGWRRLLQGFSYRDISLESILFLGVEIAHQNQ